MNNPETYNRAWACFFDDGEVIFSSVSRTQKGSINLARIHMKENSWLALKSRGIRCRKVEVTTIIT